MAAKKKEVVFTGQYPPLPQYNTPVTQQKDYSSTWVEYAAQNFKQITAFIQLAGNVTRTLYVVPTNQTLFVTNSWINYASFGGAGANQNGVYLYPKPIQANFENVMNCIAGWDYSPQHLSSNISYSMPLKVPSGTIIEIFSFNDIHASFGVGIIGFLVPFVV
jgi:hypothetical protein